MAAKAPLLEARCALCRHCGTFRELSVNFPRAFRGSPHKMSVCLLRTLLLTFHKCTVEARRRSQGVMGRNLRGIQRNPVEVTQKGV